MYVCMFDFKYGKALHLVWYFVVVVSVIDSCFGAFIACVDLLAYVISTHFIDNLL